MEAREKAIRAWVARNRPELQRQVDAMLGNDGTDLILAIGFEAGRTFQDANGGIPLGPLVEADYKIAPERDPGHFVGSTAIAGASALTVEETLNLLSGLERSQRLVFSDQTCGDFDLVGDVGSNLSEDNFVNDRRPILRLRKR